jgi:hypothetical protein
MLYNKYRGLLRVYLYINDLQFSESSYLQDGLYLGTNTYKMLNFADKDIVDVSQPNAARVDRVEPKPYSGAPLANNKWYFLQYEVAYDPSIIPTTSTNPPQFSFYANSVNVQQINLGGTTQSTINGTIGSPQSSVTRDVWNEVTPGIKSLGAGALSAAGLAVIKDNTTNTTGGNRFGIKEIAWKGIKTGLDEALKVSTASIPGTIVNVLSAVIGGSSNSQTVNLTSTGTIQVDGSQTGKGALPSTPVSMYLPGSIQPNAQGGYNVPGYVPLYNESLGVFNVANKPTVQIQIKRTADYQNPSLYYYNTDYTVKPGTLNLQFNPIVNGRDADIVNVTSDILVTYNGNVEQGLFYLTGDREVVNGVPAFTGSSFRTIHHYDQLPAEALAVYVRVAFVVRPKNGGPDSVVIKTFLANTERTFTY